MSGSLPARASNVSPFPTSSTTTTSSSSTTSTSSSTTSRAHARTRETDADVQYALEYWHQATGIKCSQAIEGEMRHYATLLSLDKLAYAIDQTTFAPQPSWAYCRAILRRLAERGR